MVRSAFTAALAVGLALAGAAVAAGTAAAQDYPSRPIKFLQGFAPGGNADIISRVIGDEMAKSLGQPVINESRAGAGGNLASEMTAKAAPDGYTIVLLTTGHVISPALYKSLNFDPVKDFEFISTVSDFPFFIVVNKGSRFKTVEDIVAEAKGKPGTVTVGTAGVGTGQHMCTELFGTSTGSKFVHVPFRGDSAAVTALLSDAVDFIVAPGTAIFSNIEAGTLRALAVSGAQRWPSLPNVPTIAERVAPGLEVMAWVGVATTHGVPQPIVDRLNREVRRALDMPSVNERLRALGGMPRGSTPAEMRERTIAQIKRWGEVAEKAGIPKQ